MSQSLRHPEIIQLARRQGKVTVDGLVTHFGVTAQTIRKDLSDLADAGQLERVHGGAVVPSTTTNIEYEARRALNDTAKRSIARRAAQDIPNDCALFLSIGTTTEAVAEELRDHEGLLVVTNNMNIATILAPAKGIDVIVTGGTLRPTDGGLVGPLARQSIAQFQFDHAIIGCSALTQAGDMLDFDLAEVEVSKTVLRNATRATLVADHTKFQRSAPLRIARVQDVSCVVTDKAPPASFAEACAEAKTRVVLAP